MTTDGMKRRDFIRIVTATAGAISLSGAASLLSGCGGNGNGPSNSTPVAAALVPPTSTTPTAALPSVQAAGLSATAVTTTKIATVTATDGASVGAGMSNVVSAVSTSAPIGIPLQAAANSGSYTMLALPAATHSDLQAALVSFFTSAGLTIPSGSSYALNTYTVNGVTYSSPAIVDSSGKVLYDLTTYNLLPGANDTTHILANTAEATNGTAINYGVYNPVDGHLMYSDSLLVTPNLDVNGNLSTSNPLTITSRSTQMGADVSLSSPVTASLGAVISSTPDAVVSATAAPAKSEGATRQSAAQRRAIVRYVLRMERQLASQLLMEIKFLQKEYLLGLITAHQYQQTVFSVEAQEQAAIRVLINNYSGVIGGGG